LSDFGYIKENLEALLAEIKELSRVGEKDVTLVCVTKSGSDEELSALAEAGAKDIGENRPQELRRRGDLLREKGFTPALHEIGNLQRNKVKLIIESVSLIHSLDTIALAKEIDRQAERVGRCVPVLIEINSAREEQKGGVLPEDAEKFLNELSEFSHLQVMGLMTMGPVVDDPEKIRPYFKLTKELFDRLNRTYGFVGGGILSMGMSDSYKVAIEEGSTLVRVGRRLFNKN
jgi:pyridoxal phosphate enzyme (YggS family)